MSTTASVEVPRESLARGGPVAQIAMLCRSMVEEERWVTSEHFNRALAPASLD